MRQLQNFTIESARAALVPFPAYIADELGLFMRIGDDILKTVVFVGLHPEGMPFVPIGTGFLVAVRVGTIMFPFVVTARHVIEMVAGAEVAVRFNDKAGRAGTAKIAKATIWLTQDKAKDVAAIPLPVDPSGIDQRYILMDSAHWAEARQKVWDPKLGDEIVTIGLYSSHYGQLKNIPVVRVGHLAMMPGEPVRTQFGYVQAYLAEVKSIAGLSGSPVFVNMPEIRITEQKQLEYLPNKMPHPIGMMLGYHLVETAEDQIPVAQMQGQEQPSGYSSDERNTGFGVVLPVSEIFAMFEDPQVQQSFKETAEMHLKKGYRAAGVAMPLKAAPTEDRVSTPTAENNPSNPRHKEDFTSLLDAASKKQTPDR